MDWYVLSLPPYYGAGQKRASFIFNWTTFILFDSIKIESNVVMKPTVYIIAKIAKALGVSIEDLIK